VTRTSAWPACLLAAAALAGCGSSPTTHFYTLSAPAEAARAEAKASPVVAIGAVTLPEGLDRPQIVLRTGASQVSFSEFERWNGPLRDEIARALAQSLRAQLGGANVFVYPLSADVKTGFRLLVDVQRFDSVLGDAVTLEVLWQLVPPKGAAQTGRSSVREPAGGPGYGELVAAHGRALAAVGRDIAAAIRASASP
jgi:uncharacterized lipoprotein YmbA